MGWCVCTLELPYSFGKNLGFGSLSPLLTITKTKALVLKPKMVEVHLIALVVTT